jgi:prolyl-tRNA synthetase
MNKAIPPKNQDYSAWYNAIVKQAGLAENSSVRGCMIVKPYGFAIWENIKDILDNKFKETGHVNAYFPIFIPKSLFSKESKHVEGFAKECAIVTHYRLKQDNDQIVVDPSAKLEEELVVRPTSEAIIWDTYKNWIRSYRDLPLLINQWANVVRWEMRNRLFLRTTEILWQEGHTAHSTSQEAHEEAIKILNLYASFMEEYMAMPVICGVKTETEKFAGAEVTYTLEALMQDGKALQAGTAHFLGQNFAKAFDVQFTNSGGQFEYVWGTSWGLTSRLIGALIMTHSDDAGLVLPPKLAPIQVVIIPIYKEQEKREEIFLKAKEIEASLSTAGIYVKLDDDDKRTAGWKFSEYEVKGVPIRIMLGARDLEKHQVEIVRRVDKKKIIVSIDNLAHTIASMLDDIQKAMYEKAKNFLDTNITKVEDYEVFKSLIKDKGGFFYVYWDGSPETELKIKQETGATIRCIPNNPLYSDATLGHCIYTGKPTNRLVLIAKSY